MHIIARWMVGPYLDEGPAAGDELRLAYRRRLTKDVGTNDAGAYTRSIAVLIVRIELQRKWFLPATAAAERRMGPSRWSREEEAYGRWQLEEIQSAAG